MYKPKKQYLHTLQVSRYCLLALQTTTVLQPHTAVYGESTINDFYRLASGWTFDQLLHRQLTMRSVCSLWSSDCRTSMPLLPLDSPTRHGADTLSRMLCCFLILLPVPFKMFTCFWLILVSFPYCLFIATINGQWKSRRPWNAIWMMWLYT